MPLYDFKCQKCGQIMERIANVVTDVLPCDRCDGSAKRQFSFNNAPYVIDDYDFIDFNLGHDPVYIHSRRQRARIMKERGLYEAG